MSETVRTVDGVAVITVEGTAAFVLDFGEVNYLNSMNIAAIISLRSKLESAGARLALANLSEHIASVFRILKLERLFELGYDTDRAVAAVKA